MSSMEHYLEHTEASSHTSEGFNKRLSQESDLEHLRVHTNEKNFTVMFAEKVF